LRAAYLLPFLPCFWFALHGCASLHRLFCCGTTQHTAFHPAAELRFTRAPRHIPRYGLRFVLRLLVPFSRFAYTTVTLITTLVLRLPFACYLPSSTAYARFTGFTHTPRFTAFFLRFYGSAARYTHVRFTWTTFYGYLVVTGRFVGLHSAFWLPLHRFGSRSVDATFALRWIGCLVTVPTRLFCR